MGQFIKILKRFKSQKGQSLVELLLAIGLASVILPPLLTSLVASRDGRDQALQRLKATSYLQEAQEAVRVIKENWSSISTNGTYHPTISGSTWALASGNETLDGQFTRYVVIESVYRNPSGAIVESPGGNDTLDPSTKKITITVSWQNPYPSSSTIVSYATRHENTAFLNTTQTQFNAGNNSSTTVTSTTGTEVTDDGQVILGAGGGGDWCDPNLSITALDLPKSGIANSISAIEGRVFAGTGENASGVSFANINVTNTNPPVASVAGTFNGYKTNAIFGVANYAYLATDNNSREAEIVNLTTNPPSEAGYFNPFLNQDGNGIFVVGNVGYLTTGNVLYTFDLSSSNASKPMLGSLFVTLFGTARKIWVTGNYAYIAVDGYSLKELSIVDVSDPRNLREVGWADVNGTGGKEVYVNSTGTRAYLATSADPLRREFFIIDTSSKTGSRPIVGSYDANGMSPLGVAVVPGNKAILVGTGGEEYQVLDISRETSPTLCGGLQIDSGVKGVSGVLEADGDAYSYIVTGDANAELKIIEGGPGGQYSTSGTYTSSPYDVSYSTTFNRFDANILQPVNTEIKMQVAVADAVSGSCTGASYSFVGPDGTSGTYFTASNNTISGEIPLKTSGNYTNPGRCFEYKVFLKTTDPLLSPSLYDVSVNYAL